MNDRTKAMALELAEKYLVKQGWRFTPEDIGYNAALMLNKLDQFYKREGTK